MLVLTMCDCEKGRVEKYGGGSIYGIGGIGALIYFLQSANSFGTVIVGILKAIVWPAFLIHKLFGFIGM